MVGLAICMGVTTAFTYHIKWLVMTKIFMLTPVQGFSIVKNSTWTRSRGYVASNEWIELFLVWFTLECQAMLTAPYMSGGFILQFGQKNRSWRMSNIHLRPRWPISLWAWHIASNLYFGGTTNCNLLWSHIAQILHWYRTPSCKHSFSHCLSSWDISSLIFTVWCYHIDTFENFLWQPTLKLRFSSLFAG